MTIPDTANPKDANGRAKLPLHLWPASATATGCIGFLEGELKYGRNNFRAANVAASVYVAAAKRHLDAWAEGEDNAADTGSPHLGNALACIAILVDAQANGSLIDDRNFTPAPGAHAALVAKLTAQAASLKKQFAGHAPKHWDARDNAPAAAEQTAAKGLMGNVVPLGTKSDRNTDAAASEPKSMTPEKQCDCLGCVLERAFSKVKAA